VARRGWLKWANLAGSLAATAALLYVTGVGLGPLPGLGRILEPGTGAWTVAADSLPPHDQTLHLSGLQFPVQVVFDAGGVPHIHAATDRDAFVALGYLHARFRLFQMDLIRRVGEGRLAEAFGRDALDNDHFELDLGLVRTAEQEWRQMQPEERSFLLAYSEGVNDRIREDLASSNLPLLFKVSGYEPRPWAPFDSLVMKGVETQSLDFQEGPLRYAQLAHALGADRAASWFPMLAPDQQHPFATGPYASLQPAALPGPQPVAASEARAAGAVADRIDSLLLPRRTQGNSNNWAVDGSLSATGKALLAGDPHLDLTLPSTWYQVDIQGPTLQVQGVTFPGGPFVVIGRNQHIAWSETNTQNQATLYYREQTDSAHPGQYFWKGEWRSFATAAYDIPVKGGGHDHHRVRLTVHGPVITLDGQALAVEWMGALPSDDGQVLIDIARATGFEQFRNALRGWHAPSQNFVYADDAGNIGVIAAGYYPLVAAGNPALPLSGTGEQDVTGSIPFEAIPQVYDPPTHFVFSANQRPVTADYPYYIGNTLAEFDAGYRAAEIQRVLGSGSRFTRADMERLQNDNRDYLAGLIVPRLLDALGETQLTADLDTARSLLRSWDGLMSADSAAAAIWWSFWQAYRDETFGPWWARYHVRVDQGAVGDALNEDLEAWTLRDPANVVFSPPGGARRTAPEVMVKAFATAVDTLTRQLGGDPERWSWGAVHKRSIGSLVGIPSLAYGPRAAAGDSWTVDAAPGGQALLGPSFRFVVDWTSGTAWAVYPGGQSENPVSSWYADRVDAWWRGDYLPMEAPAKTTWSLRR
jgi:penicillin amidase